MRRFFNIAILALGGSTVSLLAEQLVNEHIDVSLRYDAGADPKLDIRILVDRARDLAADEAIFVAPERAKLTLPAGTPFGEEGQAIWVLPQGQDTSLLYMGFSAELIPFGVFDGPLEVQLLSVHGPGDFFLWQAGSVGGLEIKMNTRDGIDASDQTTPFTGSHEHMNWGFSTNGIYRVSLRALGRRLGEETNITSNIRTLEFHVLPLATTPFEQWQLEKFGAGASDEARGPGADPDGDGAVNLVEYAHGLDPLNPLGGGWPAGWVEGVEAGVEFRRDPRATDVRFEIESTDSLERIDWKPASGTIEIVAEEGAVERVRFVDDAGLLSERFYRLKLSLSP